MGMQSCCAIPTAAWYVTEVDCSNDFFFIWKLCLKVPRLLPFTGIWRVIHIREAIYPQLVEIFVKVRCLEIWNQADCILVNAKPESGSIMMSSLFVSLFWVGDFSFLFPGILHKLRLNPQLASGWQPEPMLETEWKRNSFLHMFWTRALLFSSLMNYTGSKLLKWGFMDLNFDDTSSFISTLTTAVSVER